ncbi:porin family protein [Hymenobacter properus]|uniref:PorT family protein n=1 Tax=Hymenobacter properus TaxID=2791026 RepID=A0A931BLE5_9BACT|nr:porin family protein [Hymenobacter properus]MBF9142398.1 PorT family protein [Hymenobacter properus]MBR7721205.1 PorT family protein [Microvirga sp. SRT04]
MKKLITTLALLLGAYGAAQAQSATTFGITVGYGRDRILSNNQYTSVSHSAYQAGLTADFKVSDKVSFHPEVLYSKRYFDTSNDENLNRDITSIDVPLLVRYHLNGLYLEAGPAVDFPIKAVNEDAADTKSELNGVVLNYMAGVGYRFGKGPSLGVRYDGGASNIFKSNTSTVLGTGKFKSSAVWAVLAYSFGG